MVEIHTDNPSDAIEHAVKTAVNEIKQEVQSRAFRAANQLANATSYILRGQRSGRIYSVPNTHAKYQASAPGEAPANRTGIFRLSWQRRVYAETNGRDMIVHAVVESNESVSDGKLLGRILEEGAPKAKIVPRPYKQRVIDRAAPGVQRIYKQRY